PHTTRHTHTDTQKDGNTHNNIFLTQTHTRTHTHTLTHAHTHTYTHASTHTHTHAVHVVTVSSCLYKHVIKGAVHDSYTLFVHLSELLVTGLYLSLQLWAV